jgi:nucleoid-associated protein YgaU
MGLEHALIIPQGGIPIPALFNPTEYSIEKSNEFAQTGIPGLGAPVTQYVRGGGRTLSMDLFFDTYELNVDVRVFTALMYRLLDIRGSTHAPPVCVFTWGLVFFRCVIERISGRFTMFFSTGMPARATLSVTMREYIDVSVQVRAIPTESADHHKSHTVKRGETLSGIASAEYDDPASWRAIADANGIANPRVVAPGTTLVLPPTE